MLLDLYTLGLLVIVGRGFYVARMSCPKTRLFNRLIALSPSILSMFLIQRIFCSYSPDPTIQGVQMTLAWLVAILYFITPFQELLGCEYEPDGDRA